MNELEICLIYATAWAIGLCIVFSGTNVVSNDGISLNGPPILHNHERTSDLAIAQLPPYEPTVIVDLSVIPNMTNESIANITICIGKNQSQNVTIWKGDEIVAYIPANIF